MTLRQIEKNFATKLDKSYRFEYDTDTLIARLYQPTPKGKYAKEKCVSAYKFQSKESMIKYYSESFNNYVDNLKRKQEYKAKRKAELYNNDVKVGDVFCYSWGWEQTNVDFYQVVEKPSKCFAIVRPIYATSVEETSWASDYVKPSKDSFIGEETERVRLTGDSFKRSCGHAIRTNLTDKHYRSWYA